MSITATVSIRSPRDITPDLVFRSPAHRQKHVDTISRVQAMLRARSLPVCGPSDVNGAGQAVTVPPVPGPGVHIPFIGPLPCFVPPVPLVTGHGLHAPDLREGFFWSFLDCLDAPVYVAQGSVDSMVFNGRVSAFCQLRIR